MQEEICKHFVDETSPLDEKIEESYELLFGRSAEEEELLYWSNVLADSDTSTLQVCHSIADGARGEDRDNAQERLKALEVAESLMEEKGWSLGTEALEDMLFNLRVIDPSRYPIDEYVYDYLSHRAIPASEEEGMFSDAQPAEGDATSPGRDDEVMVFLINDLLFL